MIHTAFIGAEIIELYSKNAIKLIYENNDFQILLLNPPI